MPGKKTVFRPSSILVRPRHNAPGWLLQPPGRALVEAPGTAPGSDRCITPLVYRHSRPCDRRGEYRRGNGWREGGSSTEARGMRCCCVFAGKSPRPQGVRGASGGGFGGGHSRRAPGRGAREGDPDPMGLRPRGSGPSVPRAVERRARPGTTLRRWPDRCRGGGAAIWPSSEVVWLGWAVLRPPALWPWQSSRGPRASMMTLAQPRVRRFSQRSARRSSRSTGSTEVGRWSRSARERPISFNS